MAENGGADRSYLFCYEMEIGFQVSKDSGKPLEWREGKGAVLLFSVKIFFTTFSLGSLPYPTHPPPALAAPGAASPPPFSLALSSHLQSLSIHLVR